MRKKNFGTVLGIALVVALVATGVFYGLFVSKLKSAEEPGTTLVIAAKPMPAGTVLTSADVKTIRWSAATLPVGAFEHIDQVSGKTLFDGVGEGEPLLAARLASLDGTGGSVGVPSGMRAVSVHVTDSSGVVSLLRAGHKVDVQVLVSPGKNGEKAQLRTAIENLEVLSVNPKNDQSSQGYNLPVVTLLAKPDDADVLALADSGARVRLTLRNALDSESHPRTAVSLSHVMQTGN
ncbi:MAG: Flp pilus assembly protein CpaB [Acidobacteriota bacterium]